MASALWTLILGAGAEHGKSAGILPRESSWVPTAHDINPALPMIKTIP